MEAPQTPKGRNLEKKRMELESSDLPPQTVLQTHSHPNNVVLPKRHGSADPDRKPCINPHAYGQLGFSKRGKTIDTVGKARLFNTRCWENWTAMRQRPK